MVITHPQDLILAILTTEVVGILITEAAEAVQAVAEDATMIDHMAEMAIVTAMTRVVVEVILSFDLA